MVEPRDSIVSDLNDSIKDKLKSMSEHKMDDGDL